MKVFVSTGAFQYDSFDEILECARDYGIQNIELAPGLKYDKEIVNKVRKYKNDFQFLIHNYFPTPKEKFALNLASNDSYTVKSSIAMCRNNIDLASELGIPFYSIHCGFCFDTNGQHLGNESQKNLEKIPYKVAKDNFIRNVREVNKYALSKGVMLAIENNVVAKYVSQEHDMFLGVTAEDIVELLNLIDSDNVRFLLDLAHAKVSSTFYNFNVLEMINRLNEYILEVHVSDNDGYYDLNKGIGKHSYDILNWINKIGDTYYTIEAYDLTPEEILEQIDLIKGNVR